MAIKPNLGDPRVTGLPPCQQVFRCQGSQCFPILLTLSALWECCLVWGLYVLFLLSQAQSIEISFCFSWIPLQCTMEPWFTLEAKWIFHWDGNRVPDALRCLLFPFVLPRMKWHNVSRFEWKVKNLFRLSCHSTDTHKIIQHDLLLKSALELTVSIVCYITRIF